MKLKLFHVTLAASLVVGFSGLSCSSSGGDNGGGSGGHSSSGGSNGSGGSASGGSSSGGHVGSGGSGSGGSETSSGGHVGSGGSASGGSSSGGNVGSGGSASGGSASGGNDAGTGGTASGGSSSGGVVGTGGGAAGGPGPGGMMGSAGAKGSGGSAGGASGGGFTAVATLLGMNCGTGGCHDGTAHTDLRNTTGLYTRLVNAMPTGSMAMTACKSKKLVVANDPSTSVLSEIIKAQVSGCSNARMPDNCSTSSANPRRCLTADQISTIDSWIMAGATM